MTNMKHLVFLLACTIFLASTTINAAVLPTAPLSSTSANVPRDTSSSGNNGVLLAPQPTDPIPPDVAIYDPKGPIIDMTDFFYWRQNVRGQSDTGTAHTSRFMKIVPGSYGIKWTDQEHNTMDVTFWDGGSKGWTLDLRGVTIQYDVGPSNPGAPNPFFYVNQAPPSFTILGGSIWQYTGEIWSQATVVSKTPNPSAGFDMSLITAKLDPGYALQPWINAGINAAKSNFPPPLSCMDESNPDHWVRCPINMWYMNFQSMKATPDNGGTVSFSATSRSNINVGHVLSVLTGNEMATTLVNEENHGLVVRGLTCNGGFTYIGRDSAGPPKYIDVLVANPPLPPGLGPRANGPTMSHGHIDNFELCEFQPCDTYENSFWMYTGNVKDLAVLEEGARLPN